MRGLATTPPSPSPRLNSLHQKHSDKNTKQNKKKTKKKKTNHNTSDAIVLLFSTLCQSFWLATLLQANVINHIFREKKTTKTSQLYTTILTTKIDVKTMTSVPTTCYLNHKPEHNIVILCYSPHTPTKTRKTFQDMPNTCRVSDFDSVS